MKGDESKVRILQIRNAILEIERYTNREDEKSFSENNMLNNAVLFQFSIIGEAVNHVNEDLLKKYEYPWYRVRSFRNLIIHEYFNIKLSAVWNIIVNDLPDLKEYIEQILDNEF